MLLAEPIEIALQIGTTLDAMGLAWLVGGSVASSLYGIPRATQDIDLVVEMTGAHVDKLVRNLEADFYIDADMIRQALRRRGSFNVIHLATMTKIDIFLLKRDALSRAEMTRRQLFPVDEEGQQSLPLASPEDIILQKLDWYRKSGRSERQWRDVLGVLKVRRPLLDMRYLTTMAEDVGLVSLLNEAMSAAQKT